MRFSLAVSFLLSLIVVSVCGAFHYCILDKTDGYVCFYISSSFFFLFFSSYLLLLYCVYNNNISLSENYVNNFTKAVIKSDSNFITFKELSKIRSKFLESVLDIFKGKILLFCVVLPCFISFMTSLVLIFICDVKMGSVAVVSMVAIHIVLSLVNLVVRMTDISSLKFMMDLFCHVLLNAARGIQFFNIEKHISAKTEQEVNNKYKHMQDVMANKTWKTFFLGGLVFCFVLFVYMFLDSRFSQNLFVEMKNYSFLMGFCLASYTFSLQYFHRFRKLSKNTSEVTFLLDNIPQLVFSDGKTDLSHGRDLFIAFHGVCFHKDGFDLLQNVTFSALPGEFIVITGENLKKASYIFDLLLKFYKPQSGSIYIAGNNIEILNSKSLRSFFSVFRTDFGLVPGSVSENIHIAAEGPEEKTVKIAEKVGLLDFLENDVLDSNGNISVPQEILIRLQIARVFMRKHKIVLIEEPEAFDSSENEELFFDFIKFISQRKTIIMSTKSSSCIIYANKILYIGRKKVSFGSHADLSGNLEYCNFLSNL